MVIIACHSLHVELEPLHTTPRHATTSLVMLGGGGGGDRGMRGWGGGGGWKGVGGVSDARRILGQEKVLQKVISVRRPPTPGTPPTLFARRGGDGWGGGGGEGDGGDGTLTQH